MRTFEQIYKQHYAAIYRYALSLSQDAHTAEDLTQETFAKALLSLDENKSITAYYLYSVNTFSLQYI